MACCLQHYLPKDLCEMVGGFVEDKHLHCPSCDQPHSCKKIFVICSRPDCYCRDNYRHMCVTSRYVCYCESIFCCHENYPHQWNRVGQERSHKCLHCQTWWHAMTP